MSRTETIELDIYVIDSLMPDLVGHDRAPSVLVVYLLLWRRTRGAHCADIQLSLADLAIATGLSKRTVQEALAHLLKRKLIDIARESITAVPVYSVKRPWVRS